MNLLIPLALMVAIVGGLALAFLSGAGRRRLSQRARRISAPGRGARVSQALTLRVGGPGGLDRMAIRFLPNPDLLRQRLAASGLSISIGAYSMICINFGVAVTVVALLDHLPAILAVLVGALAALLLPHFVVGFLVNRRRNKFSKLFPDAIGLMVRGLKAGLPVVESMLVVGREVSDPVGAEFRRVGDQVRLGQGLEESLWAIAKRLDLAEFNFLVITLSIQRETGGNLAETLEGLDDMIRKRQQMKLKVKAMSSEAMATAGIIGSLPFVMTGILFLVSRKYILTLFQTDIGHILIGVGSFWMCVGFVVMKQMVSFEI
ncbi:MAG TPA: type II secretion system F family protein [Caulobacteraceae bacterium]